MHSELNKKITEHNEDIIKNLEGIIEALKRQNLIIKLKESQTPPTEAELVKLSGRF